MSENLSARLRKVAQGYTQVVQDLLGDKLVSMVLFGSVARGEANALSDLDLLVVAEELPRGRFARRRLLQPAQDAVDPDLKVLWEQGAATDLCVLIETPEQAGTLRPLYLDFVHDAIILYDRDDFFAGVLKRLRESLERLGARRRTVGQTHYWDLKPDYVPGETFEL